MSLLHWGNKKKANSKINKYVLDDEDRRLSSEVRKIRHETKIQEELSKYYRAQADATDAENDYLDAVGEEEEQTDLSDFSNNPDAMFQNLLINSIMTPKNQNQATNANTAPNTPPVPPQPLKTVGVGLSSEQIKQFWDGLPPYIQKSAKKASNEDVLMLCRAKIPNLDTPTQKKILDFIRKV